MAIKLALDTNSYSNLCRGHAAIVQLVQQATVVALPVIVLAELKAGFKSGQLASQNAKQLNMLLQDNRFILLHIDTETVEYYANFAADLRRQGTPIPTNDLWIAALVAQYNYPLLTSDKHFDHLPNLPRINA